MKHFYHFIYDYNFQTSQQTQQQRKKHKSNDRSTDRMRNKCTNGTAHYNKTLNKLLLCFYLEILWATVMVDTGKCSQGHQTLTCPVAPYMPVEKPLANQEAEWSYPCHQQATVECKQCLRKTNIIQKMAKITNKLSPILRKEPCCGSL